MKEEHAARGGSPHAPRPAAVFPLPLTLAFALVDSLLRGPGTASASARAEYANFLQASRGFAQNYVDAVLERMRFQSGALEVLVTLLEMARRLRGDAAQLKVSFRKGPCKQFKRIIKEGGVLLPQVAPLINRESMAYRVHLNS
jgi:hypothetical protein